MSRSISNGGARIAEVRAEPRQHPTVRKPATVIRIKLEILVLLCGERLHAHVDEKEIEEAAREYIAAIDANRAPMTDPERHLAVVASKRLTGNR